MNRFEWVDATRVESALARLQGGAAVKAGGVDLLDLMKERVATPPRVVNVRNVPGLDGVSGDATTGLRLGPLVTLARLAADPLVRGLAPALAEAAGRAATPQVRNVATLGGNLLQRPRCWYFRADPAEQAPCRKRGGDACFAVEGQHATHAVFGNGTCAIVHPSSTAVPLVALGATVELTGPKGARTLLLEEFFTTPEEDVTRECSIAADELITAVQVAPWATSPAVRSAYVKHAEKESFDWPLADVAVVLVLAPGGVCERASVVLGAAAPVPWRAREAEAALVGKRVDEGVARAAARAALAGATPLPGNAYKLPVFEVIVRRALLAAAGGAR